jgi:hypothetical protein
MSIDIYHKDIVIVVPIYKSHLNSNETKAYEQLFKILNQYDITLVTHKAIDIQSYKTNSNNLCIEYFPEYYFNSVESYSLMLMSSKFYSRFRKYKYMLIYQLDAYIFEDNLVYWAKKEYSYIGAPWISSEWLLKLEQKFSPFLTYLFFNKVGNGGFSLRKISHFYWGGMILKPFSYCWPKKWNEDSFWSNVAPKLLPFFKIPKQSIALKFAFETKPSKCYELNNRKLPLGCHAWEKYEPEFWENYIK